MYPVLSRAPAGRGWSAGLLREVPRNVLLIGLTSCLTDVSSEMITSILPLYLVAHLGFSPAGFGAIDALHQGGASVVRLVSGWLSDRSQHFKRVAGAGYALSAACRAALLLGGTGASSIAAITFADRLGKGVRAAPRDALISLSAEQGGLGRAFGAHRAMDTAGAVIGPLIAFQLLRLVPGAFAAVFAVSFAFALLGIGVLAAFVSNPAARRVPAHEPQRNARTGLSSTLGLLRDRKLSPLLLSAGLLGALTISDGMLFLMLQRRLHFEPGYLPLLYVAVPCVCLSLAFSFGRLADRWGRAKVLLLGHALLILVYWSEWLPARGGLLLALNVLLLGAFYAASDGVLLALASARLPEPQLASGLGLIVTVNNLGRLLASVAFGLLWSHYDERIALIVFGAVLTAVLAALAATLLELDVPARGAPPLLRG